MNNKTTNKMTAAVLLIGKYSEIQRKANELDAAVKSLRAIVDCGNQGRAGMCAALAAGALKRVGAL